MNALDLPGPLIDDASVAVSELATNALQHGVPADSACSPPVPELWVWPRTAPSPQLVIAVYDADRDAIPVDSGADLLDECGKGLAIVAALSIDQGWHLTRSRLQPSLPPGKCTWFTVALPTGWTAATPPPPAAGRHLLVALGSRGLNSTRHNADTDTIVVMEEIDVHVEPSGFAWKNHNGEQVHHPLADLQEAAEQIVAGLEQAKASLES